MSLSRISRPGARARRVPPQRIGPIGIHPPVPPELFDLDVGAPHRVADLLGTLAARLAHHHLLGDPGGLADHRLFGGLGHFDRAFTEGVALGGRERLIHRPALDPHPLVAQTDSDRAPASR